MRPGQTTATAGCLSVLSHRQGRRSRTVITRLFFLIIVADEKLIAVHLTKRVVLREWIAFSTIGFTAFVLKMANWNALLPSQFKPSGFISKFRWLLGGVSINWKRFFQTVLPVLPTILCLSAVHINFCPFC